MKKIFSLLVLMLVVGTVSAEKVNLYSVFTSVPNNNNISFDSSSNTLKAWGSNANTYQMFSFPAGTLSHYDKLYIPIDNTNYAKIRIILLDSDGNAVFTGRFGSGGNKTITLSGWNSYGSTLSDEQIATITEIRIGGYDVSTYTKDNPCTYSINPANVYLEREKKSTSTLNATFGTPGNSAGYGYYYSCTAATDNLIKCFTFSSGELANYTSLDFTLTKLTGSIRINFLYNDGSADQNMNINTDGEGTFGNGGNRTISTETILSAIKTKSGNNSLTLAAVKEIHFGGNGADNNVYLTNMRLTGASENLAPTFTKMGGQCTFTENYYGWTSSTANLMDVFTFGSGELANYTSLSFTFSGLKADSKVRMGYYVNSSWTNLKTNISADGTYTINLLDECAIDYATITRICFGGNSNDGYCIISPSNVTLSNQALVDALERQFTIGRKSTVCLPFGLTEEEASAAGSFYELSNVNGTTLSFTEVTTPAAYTPYVFVPAQVYPFAFLTKTVASTATKSSTIDKTVGSYTFHGVLASGTVPSGAYGYNASTGAFSKTTSASVTIDAFRAYIIGPSVPTARLGVTFEDNDATGIETVKQAQTENDVMYNLAGQRVSSNHKGLVIKNGRKYFVK